MVSRRTETQLRFLRIAVALLIVIAVACWALQIRLLYGYLISINVVAVLFYAYDKLQARRKGFRIPETVLHILSLVGGSLGALLAMLIFRHKVRKARFILVYALIVIGQLSAVYWYRTGGRLPTESPSPQQQSPQ